MLRRLFLLLSLTATLGAQGQNLPLRVVSWNVENLFDCNDDSLHDDHDFLPQGTYRWTTSRYWRKLDNVARTIAALTHEDQWPALVALCEVENDIVMHDLTRRSPLRLAHYDYVITDSPDRRGIDVALMYQPAYFQLLHWEAIGIPSEAEGLRPTRDILHVAGKVASGDTLHVIAVHLPSQAGGTRASSRNRELATTVLARVVDSLCHQPLVVMGDFNAEPDNKVLRRLTPPLVSLVAPKKKRTGSNEGTYYFRNRWCYLDHILVSPRLAQCSDKMAQVARLPHLLTPQGTPWRTFRGPSYAKGYSDHLPITTTIYSHPHD